MYAPSWLASDDAVGRLLHENVVAKGEDDERVARMHREVQELTSVYGPLATDSVMLQESLDRLRDLRRRVEKAIGHVGEDTQPLLQYASGLAEDATRNLEGEQRFLAASLDKVKTAIDVVRTRVAHPSSVSSQGEYSPPVPGRKASSTSCASETCSSSLGRL